MNPIRTLLIIDDDEVFVYLTKKTIQETNLINLINVFGNGLDAINFIKENIDNPDSLPEIILLDLSMPIMDGWDFLEDYLLLMPKLSRKINIYIVSSSISPFDIVKAKSISAVSDYIIKPITREKLIEIIKPL
jgi:CheY-like chemotaxis protein